DLDVRRRCFWLLIVYVGSGMSLLLATSFLGLRKYLRQRRLEMPLDMTATWLGAGLALIVATIVVAALLPRPSPEYSLARWVDAKSREHVASRFAVGPEGAKDSPDQPSQSAAPQQEGQQAERQGAGQPNPNNQQGKSSPGKKGSGEGKQSQSKQGESKQGESKQGSGKQGESKQPDSNQKSSDSQNKSPENPATKNEQRSAESEQRKQSEPARQQQSQTSSTQQLARSAQNMLGSVGSLLKALFYLALFIVAAVLAWRYRAELLAAWQKLLAELRALWEGWFGLPAAAVEASPAEVSTPPRPFAAFTDPFASGQSARMSPAEIVRYTFQALEAWGRENGQPREPGQTAHEFAAAIGRLDRTVASEARQLADLYSHLAYAPPSAIRATFDPLRSLWQKMKSPVPVVIGG
ncbi:MAG: DUF4129 domain-containing protein, partial [Pirellulaceae bacterium]